MHKILKVIYAPHKAFLEIAQDPRYAGPMFIMIFFLSLQIGSFYITISKSYIEQTFPRQDQLDIWTEDSTLWKTNSEVIARDNYDDYIKGTCYGNRSIEFSIVDSRLISIELDGIEPMDCYGLEGYKNLSLRIKLIGSGKPQNVTIYLFSMTTWNYFYRDLTEEFSSFSFNIWNNLTIPVGSEGWLANNDAANWNMIKGLKLMFLWSTNVSVTLRVDGLFFRGVFKSLLDITGVRYLLGLSLTAFLKYILQWTFFTGSIWIVCRSFKVEIPWTTLMVVIGFTFVPVIMQGILDIVTRSTMPSLYYPLELIGNVEGESRIAYDKILETTSFISQISTYVQVIGYVWTVMLCAIAVHHVTRFSWIQSFLVSATAFAITFLGLSFLLG